MKIKPKFANKQKGIGRRKINFHTKSSDFVKSATLGFNIESASSKEIIKNVNPFGMAPNP